MWNIEERDLYNVQHLVVKHMYDSDHAAVIWFGFVRGQMLKDHETTSAAIIQVLKGTIRLTTRETREIHAGRTVELQPRERHALEAVSSEALVQLVLVPHPRYHSLAETLDLPPSI